MWLDNSSIWRGEILVEKLSEQDISNEPVLQLSGLIFENYFVEKLKSE